MVDRNLGCEYIYIYIITWDKKLEFSFSGDKNPYMKAFNNAIKVLPISDMKVSFEDDV